MVDRRQGRKGAEFIIRYCGVGAIVTLGMKLELGKVAAAPVEIGHPSPSFALRIAAGSGVLMRQRQ